MSALLNARELALRLLFQIDVGKIPLDEVLEIGFEQVRPNDADRAFADEVVRGVMREADTLDGIIGGMAEGWRLDRLARVDKTVLRIGLYELIHCPVRIPAQVISDAVEVAKKYSTEDSGRFVNGILANFQRQRQAPGDSAKSAGASPKDAGEAGGTATETEAVKAGASS